MEGGRRRAHIAAALAAGLILGVGGVAGAQCTDDAQCKAPRQCVDGRCAWIGCAYDTQCKGDTVCEGGLCVSPKRPLDPPPERLTAALPPASNAVRGRLRNAMVPFNAGVLQFKDGIAKDPVDAQAVLRLGQTLSAELDARPGAEIVALIHAEGYDGGNNWQGVVAVWAGDDPLTAVGALTVHDMQGGIDRVELVEREVRVHVKRMGPDDARCCPSVARVVRLVVDEGVLKVGPGESGAVCDVAGRCVLR